MQIWKGRFTLLPFSLHTAQVSSSKCPEAAAVQFEFKNRDLNAMFLA